MPILPAPDKLSVDVLSTRSHWYPNWLLFQASPYDSDRTIVRRLSVGQAICDVAIENGAAVAIPRNKEAVCDGMNLIKHQYPGLVFPFHDILANQAHDGRGWVLFLEAAAKHFAHWLSSDNQEMEDAAIELWYPWYCKNLQHIEVASAGSGVVFFRALVQTEKCVRRLMDDLSLDG